MREPHYTACRSVVMVGTDQRGQGGIAAVVRGYQASALFDTLPVSYIPTHQAGNAATKSTAALRGWLRIFWALVWLDKPLLHVHVASRASFWRKYVVCILARGFGRPYIMHVHGAEFVQFYQEECRPAAKRLIRATLSQAALVLALSNQWKIQLLNICPGANVEVLPNAVPLPPVKPSTESDSPKQPNFILFLGRLSQRKGTDELLNAFAKIRPGFPDVRLVCAGDGDVRNYQRLAVQLGIADNVDFPGWLSAAQCQEHLGAATIFALPSHAEGVPVSMLEAMSWQLPILTCPVGGIPEVIEDGKNGVLVPPGDVDKLAMALARLLADANWRTQLGRAARETIEERYSLERSVSRLGQFYASFGIRPLPISDA